MKEESKVPASDAQSKLRRVLAIIAVAAVILALCELTFASRKSLALGFKDAVRVDIPVDRLNVKNGVILNGGLKMQGNTVIKIPLQGVKIEYIALKFVEKPALFEVSVLAKDAAWRDSLRPYHNQRVYAGSGEAVIDYDSAGGVTTLELDFDQGAKGVVLTGIILNYAFGLHFNFLRWLLVFLVFCAAVFIKEYKPYAKTLDLSGSGAKALVCAACALCSVFALIGAVKNFRPEKYPFEKPVKEYSCYQQQTDALLKGRLDLDIEFSAGELASLKNPYDAGVRQTETSSYSALWDRAYVSETGKVYSYFGIAPVLLFYLPLTALTGYMPGDGAANLFFTLCAVAAFAAALTALLRYFKIRTDPVTLCFALCAVVCGSSVFVLNVHPTMYFTAVICGMLFFALTLNFAFRAVCAQTAPRRRVLLALAGTSVALAAASRPTALVFCVMLVPLFIEFFIKKTRPLAERMCDLAFAAVPVIAGAAAIMTYNAVRFGSPFDFGITRQLTGYDMSYCGYELYKFFPAMFHYFVQPFSFSGIFPFVSPSDLSLGAYRSYQYSYLSYGALNFPAVWGVFAALPVTGGDRVKRGTYISAVAAAVFVAFTDFCLGGVHLRYMGDILFPLCLVGALVLVELVSRSSGKPYAVHVRAAAWICMGLTVLIAGALIFDNEADSIRLNAPRMFALFENLFR